MVLCIYLFTTLTKHFFFKTFTFHAQITFQLQTQIKTMMGPFNKSFPTCASLIVQSESLCATFNEKGAHLTCVQNQSSGQFFALWKPSMVLSPCSIYRVDVPLQCDRLGLNVTFTVNWFCHSQKCDPLFSLSQLFLNLDGFRSGTFNCVYFQSQP